MSKVLLFLADGFEEVEALTAVDLLRRAGIELDTVSITDEKCVYGSHNIPVVADLTFAEADFDGSDMLILPGGQPGTTNLGKCDELLVQIKNYVNQNKYLGAICAAPTVFGKMGILSGKKACCYPSLEGALQGADVSYDSVSVDGKFITSRGVGTAIDFALAIIEELLSKEEADRIATSIVYR